MTPTSAFPSQGPTAAGCPYFESEAKLNDQVTQRGGIWVGLVFTSLASPIECTLRFDHTQVPSTERLLEAFPSGLTTAFVQFYTSGLLAMQRALGDEAWRAALDDARKSTEDAPA